MRTNAYPGDPSRGKLRDMRLGLVIAAALAVACGDDGQKQISTGNVLEDLRSLPGVASVEQLETAAPGYRYYVLQFSQRVDHADANSPLFLQKVSLLHRDLDAPMVAYTSGYDDFYNDRIVELTSLLGANQISIEHRYFAGSRPELPDWSKLTIEQMANDQHVVITALRRLYAGAFVSGGASKGGMTAVYHRRFFPDDVEGTVPYVAPLSFGAPDPRYSPYLDAIGPADCRQAVRDAAIELLANRRAMVATRAQEQMLAEGHSYTRIAFDPAVESAIVGLEWSFWQYYGAGFCADVPATSASDDVLWEFLDDISPVTDNSDARISQYDAYYYQAYFQLGFPDGGAAYLEPYVMFTDADYLGALPELPAYDDGAAMTDIDTWLRSEGDGFAFVYGEWDPWTAGQFELGGATDSLKVVQAEGSHSARISRLAPADRSAVFEKLEAWTGVTPTIPSTPRALVEQALEVPTPRPPRLPPALRRGFTARQNSP